MSEEKKERDVAETVITVIGIVCGVLVATEIALFILIDQGIVDPSKW